MADFRLAIWRSLNVKSREEKLTIVQLNLGKLKLLALNFWDLYPSMTPAWDCFWFLSCYTLKQVDATFTLMSVETVKTMLGWLWDLLNCSWGLSFNGSSRWPAVTLHPFGSRQWLTNMSHTGNIGVLEISNTWAPASEILIQLIWLEH